MAMTTSTKIEAWEDKHSVQMKVTPKDGQPIMHIFTHEEWDFIKEILTALEGGGNPINLITNASTRRAIEALFDELENSDG